MQILSSMVSIYGYDNPSYATNYDNVGLWQISVWANHANINANASSMDAYNAVYLHTRSSACV